jgi:hypothetical protein
MVDFLSDVASIATAESRRSQTNTLLSPFRYVLEFAAGALSIQSTFDKTLFTNCVCLIEQDKIMDYRDFKTC